MHQPKRLTTLLAAVAAAIASIALLASAAQAATPAPGYEEFAGCPSPDENPNIEACIISTVTGGHFQMGSKDVPITKPITLSMGGTPTGEMSFNSKGGLSAAKQLVPGGIVGLTGLDWLVNVLSLEALKLYAVTELAGTPSNPVDEPFKLPIKVHLENPVLGKKCYVGSNSNPILLSLITGTTSPPAPNKPIKGQIPLISEDSELPGTLRLENGTYVDNSFAAPSATGCRLELGLINIPIDGLVNSQSGLPAPAGTNETVQEFDGALAFAPFVYP